MGNHLNGHRSSNYLLITELNELCRAVKATKECLEKFCSAVGSAKQKSKEAQAAERRAKKRMEVEKKIATSIGSAVQSITLKSKDWGEAFRKLGAALAKVLAEELTLWLLKLLRPALEKAEEIFREVFLGPRKRDDDPPPPDPPRPPGPDLAESLRTAQLRLEAEQKITEELGRQSGAAIWLRQVLKVILDITKERLEAEREITEEMNKQLKTGAAGLGLQLVSTFLGGRLAGGGPVRAGQLYLVGERGPELFRPAGSGSIIPNGELRPALAGGGGNVFNFHIQSTDGPGVRAAIEAARPLLAQDAVELSRRVARVDLSRPSPLRGLARR